MVSNHQITCLPDCLVDNILSGHKLVLQMPVLSNNREQQSSDDEDMYVSESEDKEYTNYYNKRYKVWSPSVDLLVNENTTTRGVRATGSYHGADRITSLPDSLMSNILSRLTAKDAVRTCILSRDWKHKWYSIDNIDINDDDGKSWIGNDRIQSFYSFLDMITGTNPDLSIRRFHLYLGYQTHESVSDHLERWICKILRRDVKNLSITALSTQGKIVLSECIKRFSSLSSLHLCLNGTLKVPRLNYFRKLKSLYLSGRFGSIQISNGTTSNNGQLLLSFPFAKDLTLDHFEFLNVKLVEINAPELLTFQACTSYERNRYVIKIRAPRLCKFVSDEGPSYEFVPCLPLLRNLELVDKVTPDKTFASEIIAVLKGAPSLWCLHLSGPIVEALGDEKWIPTLNNLKRLKLTNASAKQIKKILQSTPCLESLSLTVNGVDCAELEPLPSCIVSGLKYVTMLDFNGDSTQIRLARLFIKYTRVIIDTRCREGMMDLKVDVTCEINRWIEELGPENARRITILRN